MELEFVIFGLGFKVEGGGRKVGTGIGGGGVI